MTLPPHARIAIAAMLPLAVASAACISEKDRCLPGFVYASQYHACLAEVDASADASSDAASEAASPADAGADAADAGGTPGLGAACQSSSDCTGKASYCLKSPLAPSDPGVCSVPQCTPADCGSDYACCDCGNSSIPDLKSWPRGVCVPHSDTSTVQPLGCTCQ